MDDPYRILAKNILKAELKRRGMSYSDLADLLSEQGWPETERNLNNKISRGSFSAAFLLRCLSVIGAQNIVLGE